MAYPRNDTEQFEFYSTFCKTFLYDLNKKSDRINATNWFKKIRYSLASQDEKLKYIKILLFLLVKRKLVGMFLHPPPEHNLPSLSVQEVTLGGVYRNLPDLVKQAETGSLNEGAKGDGFLKSPMAPFETTESADRKEYMALQNIPQFGVHAFYAIASEPLHEWKRNAKKKCRRKTDDCSSKGTSFYERETKCTLQDSEKKCQSYKEVNFSCLQAKSYEQNSRIANFALPVNEDLLKVVRVSKKGPIRNNALTLVQKLVDNEFWEEDHLASGEGNKELVPKGQFEFSSNFDFVPQKQSIEVRVSIIKKTIGSSKEKPKKRKTSRRKSKKLAIRSSSSKANMNNTKDIQTDILTYSNNNNPRISRSSPNLRNASTNTNQICLNVQTATEKCNDFTQKMSKSKKTAIENDKTFVMLRKKAKDFEDSSFINKGKPKFKKQNENLNKVKAAEKFPTHCQEIAKEENQFSTVSNKIRHKETFSKYNHETAQPKFYKPDCFTSNTNKTELILLKMTQTKPISSSPQKEVNSSLIPPIRPRGGDSTPRRLRRNRSNMSTPDTNDENESPNEGVCTCNDEYLQEENSNEELNWQHSDPNAMPRYNSPVVPNGRRNVEWGGYMPFRDNVQAHSSRIEDPAWITAEQILESPYHPQRYPQRSLSPRRNVLQRNLQQQSNCSCSSQPQFYPEFNLDSIPQNQSWDDADHWKSLLDDEMFRTGMMFDNESPRLLHEAEDWRFNNVQHREDLMSELPPIEMQQLPSPVQRSPERFQVYDPYATAFRQELQLKDLQPYEPDKSTDVMCGRRRVKLKKGLAQPSLTTIRESQERTPVERAPYNYYSRPFTAPEGSRPLFTPRRGNPPIYRNEPTSSGVPADDFVYLDPVMYEYVPLKYQHIPESTPKSVRKRQTISKRIDFHQQFPTEGNKNERTINEMPQRRDQAMTRKSPDFFQNVHNDALLHDEEMPSEFQELPDSPVSSPKCSPLSNFPLVSTDEKNLDDIKFEDLDVYDLPVDSPPRPTRESTTTLTSEKRRRIEQILLEEEKWMEKVRKHLERAKLTPQQLAQMELEERQANIRAQLTPKLLERIRKARNLQPAVVESPEIEHEQYPSSKPMNKPEWTYETPPRFRTPQKRSTPIEPQNPCGNTQKVSSKTKRYENLPCQSKNANIASESPPPEFSQISNTSDEDNIEENWDRITLENYELIESEKEPQLIHSPEITDPFVKAWLQEVSLKDTKIKDKEHWLVHGKKLYKIKRRPSLRTQLSPLTEQEQEINPKTPIRPQKVVSCKRGLRPVIYGNEPPESAQKQREFPCIPSPRRKEYRPCRTSSTSLERSPRTSRTSKERRRRRLFAEDENNPINIVESRNPRNNYSSPKNSRESAKKIKAYPCDENFDKLVSSEYDELLFSESSPELFTWDSPCSTPDKEDQRNERWSRCVSQQDGEYMLDSEMPPEFHESPEQTQMSPSDKVWKQELILRRRKEVPDKEYWMLQVGNKKYKTKNKPSERSALSPVTEQNLEEHDKTPCICSQITYGGLRPTIYGNDPPASANSKPITPIFASPRRYEYQPDKDSQIAFKRTPKRGSSMHPKRLFQEPPKHSPKEHRTDNRMEQETNQPDCSCDEEYKFNSISHPVGNVLDESPPCQFLDLSDDDSLNQDEYYTISNWEDLPQACNFLDSENVEFVQSPEPVQLDPFDRAWKQEVSLRGDRPIPKKKITNRENKGSTLSPIFERNVEENPPTPCNPRQIVSGKHGLRPRIYGNEPPESAKLPRSSTPIQSPERREYGTYKSPQEQPQSTPKVAKPAQIKRKRIYYEYDKYDIPETKPDIARNSNNSNQNTRNKRSGQASCSDESTAKRNICEANFSKLATQQDFDDSMPELYSSPSPNKGMSPKSERKQENCSGESTIKRNSCDKDTSKLDTNEDFDDSTLYHSPGTNEASPRRKHKKVICTVDLDALSLFNSSTDGDSIPSELDARLANFLTSYDISEEEAPEFVYSPDIAQDDNRIVRTRQKLHVKQLVANTPDSANSTKDPAYDFEFVRFERQKMSQPDHDEQFSPIRAKSPPKKMSKKTLQILKIKGSRTSLLPQLQEAEMEDEEEANQQCAAIAWQTRQQKLENASPPRCDSPNVFGRSPEQNLCRRSTFERQQNSNYESSCENRNRKWGNKMNKR